MLLVTCCPIRRSPGELKLKPRTKLAIAIPVLALGLSLPVEALSPAIVVTADRITVIAAIPPTPARYVPDAISVLGWVPESAPITAKQVSALSRIPKDKEQRCPQFESAFKQYGLVPVEVFSYIAYRESRCRIKAINIRWDARGNIIWALNNDKSYDSGILQINSTWKTVTRKVCGGGIDLLMTLDCNLKVAKYLLDNGGLRHWSIGG